MNIIPFHSKLHPKLRFSSLDPLPDREGLGLVTPFHIPPPRLGASAAGAAAAAQVRSDVSAAVPDRAALSSQGAKASVDVVLAEIAALSGSRPGGGA